MRVSLHPEGLAPRIANLAEYGGHLLTRVQRQAVLSGDGALRGAREPRWPATSAWTASRRWPAEPADLLFVPLRLRSGDDELSFFSTLASFGTALDITLAELAIEAFFPADDATRTTLRRRFG